MLPSFFKTLVDQEVTVELKNDIQIRGTLKSVDQYLNIKLDDISVVEEIKYPHLVSIEPAHDYAAASWQDPSAIDWQADIATMGLELELENIC